MPEVYKHSLRDTLIQTGEKVAIASAVSLGLLAISMGAFTESQRKWIRERDGNKCVHPDTTIRHGGRLEVHHIEPQGWGKEVLHKSEEEIDIAENGITLCQEHHVGCDGVHPDVAEAKRHYQGNTENNSFHRMFQERKEKMNKGEKYWNDSWDEEMSLLAKFRTKVFSRLNGGRPFPQHRKNGHKAVIT